MIPMFRMTAIKPAISSLLTGFQFLYKAWVVSSMDEIFFSAYSFVWSTINSSNGSSTKSEKQSSEWCKKRAHSDLPVM